MEDAAKLRVWLVVFSANARSVLSALRLVPDLRLLVVRIEKFSLRRSVTRG